MASPSRNHVKLMRLGSSAGLVESGVGPRSEMDGAQPAGWVQDPATSPAKS
jgi:hypothetical protein